MYNLESAKRLKVRTRGVHDTPWRSRTFVIVRVRAVYDFEQGTGSPTSARASLLSMRENDASYLALHSEPSIPMTRDRRTQPRPARVVPRNTLETQESNFGMGDQRRHRSKLAWTRSTARPQARPSIAVSLTRSDATRGRTSDALRPTGRPFASVRYLCHDGEERRSPDLIPRIISASSGTRSPCIRQRFSLRGFSRRRLSTRVF